MNIGLLGLSFNVGNKGCEALSYAFLEVLNKIAIRNNETYTAYIIIPIPIKECIKKGLDFSKTLKKYYPKKDYSNIKIRAITYKYIKNKYIFINRLSKCDVIFDFTAGDSFTDLYGKERFYKRTQLKEYVIKKGIPLVLGSQTIGPFSDTKVRKYATKIIKEAYEVFVRDEESFIYTKEISDREPLLTTDIAFELPYTKPLAEITTKYKIGINVSGLLWSGGYTRNNQFNLKSDYKEYCIKLISKLLENENNEIHIISHATATSDKYPDNDWTAAKEIKKMYPQIILVDKFETAMDAKSYIASMDMFIGARMHATIAALSSKVPVIAFSYSRKFEGLFNSLKYKYVIKAKELTTDEALTQTIYWIKNNDIIKKDISITAKIIKEKNKLIEDLIENTLHKIKNGGDKDVR